MRKVVLFSLACTFYTMNAVAIYEEAKQELINIDLWSDSIMSNQLHTIKEKFFQELADPNAFLTNVCDGLSETIAHNFAHVDPNRFDKNAFATLSEDQTILLAMFYTRSIENKQMNFFLDDYWLAIFKSIPADVITLMFGDNFESKIVSLSEIPDLELADVDDVPPLEYVPEDFTQKSLTTKRQRGNFRSSAKRQKNNE